MTDIIGEYKSMLESFFSVVKHQPGMLMVLGCSTSEVLGGRIGKAGAADLGEAIVAATIEACAGRGLHLAVQCCEHLNRALIVERETLELFGLDEVTVVPYPDAGGSAAAAAWRLFKSPAAIESVRADLGIDIGSTMIGMHMRPVAVPVRLDANTLGGAHVTFAYSRLKLIGGARARYE